MEGGKNNVEKEAESSQSSSTDTDEGDEIELDQKTKALIMMETDMEFDISRLRTQVAEQNLELNQKKEMIETLQNEKLAVSLKYDALKEEYNELKEQVQKFWQTFDKVKKYAKTCSDRFIEVQSAKENQDSELQKVRSNYESLNVRINDVLDDYKKKKDSFIASEREKDMLKGQVAELQTQLQTESTTVDEIRLQMATLFDDHSTLKKEFDSLLCDYNESQQIGKNMSEELVKCATF